MENEVSLAPYTQEQVTKGEKLPERITSIAHDIETGEKLKLDFVIEQIADVSKIISTKTEGRFAILGSMGMYATFNELRESDQQLILLEQRISGGKNDYDIGVNPDELQQTMSNFGWSEEARKLQRGKVGSGGQMIDVLSRNELPHFPWRQTEVDGQKILVQTPEEMIFEKMTALVSPNTDENGESRLREVKWGIDAKLLKTYLMMKNNWSEEGVEKHLAEKWEDYIEDTRYQGISELSERVAKGESVGGVIVDALKKRLGKEEIVNVSQELLGLFGQGAETDIHTLLTSSSDTEFTANMKSLLDVQAGVKLGYEQASQKATDEYMKLLK